MAAGVTRGEVHLVSHTHWDREWYQTREHFRLRLVDLVDRVLDFLGRDSGYAFFHLDGQTIVLEDYLEIRPEREERLRELIRAGRLLVGPWYVMPDEFLVSGESLVRNLAIGQRIATSFGGSMPVGYLPDLFGHVGQMPQILRGFGLDNAVLWRGFGGRAAEYWWDAPDGSRVLMMHLPGEGYCNATRVALVPDQMVERTERVMTQELERSRFGVALLMNGVDHVEPQAAIPSLVKTLNDRGWQVRHSTLPAYVEAVRRAAQTGSDLETITGELRSGEEYAPLLPGVLSARVYLKQANARAQRTLEKRAEPLSAFAWRAGANYPTGALRYAWRTLLQNHPHDSICGCSVDAVHEENMTRFARAQQVADDLVDRAASSIGATFAPPPAGRVRTIVFNTTGRPFSGLVEVTIDLPYESDEPGRHVDPEALDAPVTFWPQGAVPVGAAAPDGTACAFQVLETTETVAFVMSRYETPWALRVRRFTLAVDVTNVPGCGYMPVDWRIGEGARAERSPAGTSTEVTNGLLTIAVNADGTVDVTDARTRQVYARCGELLDEGDVGDEYTYAPPADDRLVTSAHASDVRIERLHQGPLRHAFRITSTVQVPARAASDRRRRSEELTALDVSTIVTLDRGAEYVKWETTVENTAEDHRLRMTFPAGVPRPETATADSAFGGVERPTVARPPVSIGRPVEVPVAYAPMQSFVAASDGERGMAAIVDGLSEYEVLHGEEESRMAITLLRCVGALSRDDLATRPHGHAGPGLLTPAAQCQGTHTFSLAAAPLAAPISPARLYALAGRVLTPPQARTQTASGDALPASVAVLRIEGNVVVSACKKGEDRDALVVRYFNPSALDVPVRIALASSVREAYLLDLREERQEALPILDGTIQRHVRPYRIETIELV